MPLERARAATLDSPVVNLLAVADGECLARVSMMSLLSKEWKMHYWIIEGNVLKIFKSKDDHTRVSGRQLTKEASSDSSERVLVCRITL